MNRTTPFLHTVCLAALICLHASMAQAAEGGCSREALSQITDKYFESLQSHSVSGLPLASSVKFTENGSVKEVGKGLWETAGKPLLRRTLIDTQKCVTATIAVIEEPFSAKALGSGFGGGFGAGPGGSPGAAPGSAQAPAKSPMGAGGLGPMFSGPKELPAEGTVRPILFAARLKAENGKITEIETIVARERDFAFNAENVLKTKDQDWDSILPPEQRAPRKVLADAANHYFDLFRSDSTVSVPFAKVCDRWENGLQTTARDHDCSPVTFRKQTNSNIHHGPRRVWVDTEKGIAIAFMMFGGGPTANDKNPTGSGLVDCHMFRMRNGEVDLIHAIVGPRAESMGWPLEPID